MTIKEKLVAAKEDITTRYRAGESMASIARLYQCNGGYIWTLLAEWGEPIRKISHKYDDLLPIAGQRIRDGESVTSVAKDMGIPKSTLTRMANKEGCDTSKHIKRCKYRLSDHAGEIAELYRSGLSCSKIATRFECDESNISRLLSKIGLDTRFHYKVNDDFFEMIDTEAKAYTLGFFTADGSNHCSNNTWQISICDLDVLEKMKDAMSYTGPITYTPSPKKFPHRQPQYKLTVCSQKMCADLSSKGCPPRKTFITRFPSDDEVPVELKRHYIRGLLDGDGTIYRSNNNWVCGIAGTDTLLGPIRSFIFNETGVTLGIYFQRKTYTIKTAARYQVPKVLDWLYRDATIFMQRKYDKYQQCLSELKTHTLSVQHPAGVLTPTG